MDERDSWSVTAGREIKRLTNYLWNGEVVHLVAAGQYGRGQGMVVLTDRRLLFVKDGMTRQIADAVRHRLSARMPQPSMMPPPPVYPQPPVLPPVHAVPAPPAASAEPDVYEQLRKLGELRDLGVVTVDEFEQKKRELLARI